MGFFAFIRKKEGVFCVFIGIPTHFFCKIGGYSSKYVWYNICTRLVRVLNRLKTKMKRGDGMVSGIVERYSRVDPLTETEIKIVSSAVKLFLSEGYVNTTFRRIAEDSGMKLGVITYHFRSKEDLLFLLAEELTKCHAEMIEEILDKEGNPLFAYAMEIVAQMYACEKDKRVWDLYHAIYTHLITYEHIKSWASEKNYNLFKNRLPDWTERDFREKEIIASGIELAAIKSFCDKNFTIERKIAVVLDSLLMLYETDKDEREQTIEKILEYDYAEISNRILEEFAEHHK